MVRRTIQLCSFMVNNEKPVTEVAHLPAMEPYELSLRAVFSRRLVSFKLGASLQCPDSALLDCARREWPIEAVCEVQNVILRDLALQNWP